MVRLTRIYTRGGDAGQTSLGDGARVSKADQRIDAYGTVDELNAQIGVILATVAVAPPWRDWLERIQNELFDVGADLCVPLAADADRPQRSRLRVSETQVAWLEACCDEANAPLPDLTSFVLPGGTPLAASLHVARTVCRRAERSIVTLADSEPVTPPVVAYLNRLSDLLFVLARVANRRANAGEVTW